MGEESAISWTDGTFNPLIGCAKVSPACANCYAERFAAGRMGRPELWRGERQITSPQTWGVVRKLQRAAARDGRRRRLFMASLADVFEEHPAWNAPLGDGWPRAIGRGTTAGLGVRAAALELVESVEGVDVIILTKRVENVRRMVPGSWLLSWPAHVWIGATVESQAYDHRVRELLDIPAAVRLVSAEPLLGALDLTRIRPGGGDELGVTYDALRGCLSGQSDADAGGPRIHWVITGGESGPRARPSRTDWYRSLRDQCARAGVAFHHKQNGEWVGTDAPRRSLDARSAIVDREGKILPDGAAFVPELHELMVRVGKTASGFQLDGREHREYPTTPGTR